MVVKGDEYERVVIRAVVYGMDTWGMREQQQNKLEAKEMPN